MHLHIHLGGVPLSAGLSAYVLFLAAVSGLVMGSFLNCFASRYARGESVRKGRSHCALCAHPLGAADLIPLVSWLWLRGRCRYCGGRVSPVYPLAELVSAAVYVSVALRFGLGWEALRYLALMTLLLAASFTDLHCREIPDRVVLLGIAAALLSALGAEKPLSAALHAVLGSLAVAAPLLGLTLAFDRLLGRESLGGGDIKLLFMIGLFFDWKRNLLLLIAACALGLLFALPLRRRGGTDGREIPFGPALAAGAWLVLLWGDGFIRWYLGLFV